ncbi:MAG: hypothetical protein WCO56_15105 [Verrucomicrobiota bacterium]
MKTTDSLRVMHGQRSWRLASKTVEAFITETGGHLGPVSFKLGNRNIQPFHIAPWSQEPPDRALPPILQVLRGDFFCLPFGGNGTPWKGEKHPVHGDTANHKWSCEAALSEAGTRCLHLTLDTKTRPGHVDKVLFLREGHPAVYCRHVLSGFKGPMALGHHAMLRFPETPGSGLISTSRFVYGQVFPGQFENPAQGGYSCLKAGATFTSLNKVPLATGGNADLTVYPARQGFEDLVMIVSDPKLPFAWTTVTFPKEGYLWFALKNPRILRNTVFWISNRGRHYHPWNGRHVNVMGIEDVTANFHYGLAESANPNPLAHKGLPTAIQLKPDEPFSIPYILGVAAIPTGFDRVATVKADPHGLLFTAKNGKTAHAPVVLDFLE